MQTFLTRLGIHLERAALGKTAPLRVAVVGGGVATVEIVLCLQEQFRRRQGDRPVSIEVFTSQSQLASDLHRRSVDRITRLLADRHIPVHFQSRVVAVGETSLTTEQGVRHAADCVIWATGAAAPPLLAQLGLETDPRGFLATTDTLQSLSDFRIFAVGDCGTVVQSPFPKAGVYAVRQAPVLWHNLRALIAGGPMQRFHPQRNFLKILNTGDGKAFLEYGGWSFHAQWCWKLKTWIDKRFVRDFQVPSPDA